MDELPVAVGMIVCRRVDHHPFTNRLTLVDRITRLRVERFPSEPVPLSVFTSLIDGNGSVSLTLVVDHLGQDIEPIHYRTIAEFTDRLKEVPILLRLNNLAFPAAGIYEFTLYAGTEPLTRLRVEVRGPAGE